MHRHTFLPAAALLALSLIGGCQGATTRAVKMGPVDTGATSVEFVRRQLKGTWELTALEVVTRTGEKIAPQAAARLTYDEFGNMAIRGTITGAPEIDPSVLNLTGQVVIDPVAHTMKFGAIAAASADARRVDPQLDAKNTRHYEFDGSGLLKTTVKTAEGATTATATWKKVD